MKIIVAIDDSDFCNHLLAEVCRRKWPSDSQFRLLTVIEPLGMADYGADEWGEIMEQVLKSREHAAQKLCMAARQKLEGAIPDAIVHAEIRHGDPRAEIIDSAVEWEADRIMLGARGKSICPRFTLGSVSRSVASSAACTVEIVRCRSEKHPLAKPEAQDKEAAPVK